MGSYYQGKALNRHKYPALIMLRDVSVCWHSHLRLCSFIALYIKRERKHLSFELNTLTTVFRLSPCLLTLWDQGPMRNVFSECCDHHITVWPLNVKYNPLRCDNVTNRLKLIYNPVEEKSLCTLKGEQIGGVELSTSFSHLTINLIPHNIPARLKVRLTFWLTQVQFF